MKKHVLVVGIGTYDDLEITDLSFAARDEERVGLCLCEVCGFDTVRTLSTGGDEAAVLRGTMDDNVSEWANDLLDSDFGFHAMASGGPWTELHPGECSCSLFIQGTELLVGCVTT